MLYCVVFLCLLTYTTESKKTKEFYITVHNTNDVAFENKTTVLHKYENNEVLDLSCHMERKQPLVWLKWLHNGQPIPRNKVSSTVNKLQLNITESNDNDRFECYALEDGNFRKDEKTVKNKRTLILKYAVKETTPALDVIENNEEEKTKNKKENFFQELLKNKLFWIAAAVFLVVIVLGTLVVFATEKTRIKNDKVGLHPAVSNTSVFTTESRTPILPYHETPEEHFYTNETRTDKVGLNLAVSNASFFNTESRKPVPSHTEVFYSNDTYNKNKTQLNGSREVTDSEYQEPIDSQAYCEPQMYSEPEKQFYAEPIPKMLRMKNTPYVNYNKSNASPNINNENIDLYQNCEDIHDNEFYYYTDTS